MEAKVKSGSVRFAVFCWFALPAIPAVNASYDRQTKRDG